MTVPVNKTSPDPGPPLVMADGTFSDGCPLAELRGRQGALFFRPLTFTFVRWSAIIAHDDRPRRFRERDVETVGVAIDAQAARFVCTSSNQRTFRL